MSAVTIIGGAGGVGGVASYHTRSGHLAGAHSYDEIDVTLPGDVPIDLDHDHEQRVGAVIYGEVAEDGRLLLIGVLVDDTITRVANPIYLSAEMQVRGPAEQLRSAVYIARIAELRSVALAFDPAAHGAQPIAWLRGDLRDAGHRSRWPLSWRGDHPSLARAVDHLGGLRLRTAPRLVDRREAVPTSGWISYDGTPSAGPALRRGPSSPILGVR